MIRRPRIGQRVAVIRLDEKRGRDFFDVGRIVAIKRWTNKVEYWRYAVQFDDGRIELFSTEALCTKWEKGEKKS